MVRHLCSTERAANRTNVNCGAFPHYPHVLVDRGNPWPLQVKGSTLSMASLGSRSWNRLSST